MKKIYKLLFVCFTFNNIANAVTENSNFSELLQDVFYYDKQNEEKVTTDAGTSKIQNVKDANNEKIRLIIAEQLHRKIDASHLNISVLEQERLVEAIMQQQVLNNNNVLSSISENNRITFDLINQFFDQYIVNNDKNVFIGQQTTKTNYGKFISYNKTEAPLLAVGEDTAVFITPIELTNTVNIPLNILGNFTQECDVHFISSYDTPVNSDTKVFKYRNNKLNWFRMNDTTNSTDNCAATYGTKNTGFYTCSLLNSHGTSYKEKILIPGMAYVYVPLKTEDYQFFDGTTTTTQQRIVPDTVADIKPCPSSMLINGNTDSLIPPTNSNTESCYHYFDYIKYVVNYEIDLLSGRYVLEVKENTNPFSEETQNFLMPTKLFMGQYDAKTSTETVTLGTFETFNSTNQTFTVNGNLYPYDTMTPSLLSYVFNRGSYVYTVDRTTNVTTRTLQTNEARAQMVTHASAASEESWYQTKLLSSFDTNDLEAILSTAVRLEGNILQTGINKYQALHTTTCSNSTFEFKLNLNSLITNLLQEKYYKITRNTPLNASGGCDDINYEPNENLDRCVKKKCDLDYFDGNDGVCYKEETISMFGEDFDKPEGDRDIYQYLDFNTL